MQSFRLRSAVIVVAACGLGAVASGPAGWAATKQVNPKGGKYIGKASVPTKNGTALNPGASDHPQARRFALSVDGGKRRVFNITKNPCFDSKHPTVSDPGSGSHDADVPSKHPRYGAKISHSGKISSKIKFRDRKKYPGENDRIIEYSYRISGRFASSKRAKGHLSVTAKVTTVYPGTTTQVSGSDSLTQPNFTCRTGTVGWKVKRTG